MLLVCAVIGVAGANVVNAETIVQPMPALFGAEGEVVREELSPAQERVMWLELQANIEMLRAKNLMPARDAQLLVTYDMPLRMAPGRPDYAGFRVSAFADHNAAVGATQVLDYNGGSRTYDGHRGTDYALSPFGWNKLENGDVQVIAAAAGTIGYKSDTDTTDHNPCDGGSNSDPWNYIGVLHGDGGLTLYGHLRHNSLTSKTIGQTVTQGEYLGTAASSGSSSGPHLHFEARFGNFTNAEWIDPYAGPNSQAQSLWTSQPPYMDSAINRISTHSSPPSTPNACAQTQTNLQDSFSTPQNIYFYAFYRDYQGAIPTQLKIYRPDGSVFQSWQYTTATAFSTSWTGSWLYNFPAGSPSGSWRFEAIYNGQTYETYFNVDAAPVVSVLSPNGGEQWDRMQAHAITWTDNFGGEVNIELYRDDVYQTTLASNTASDGVYLWTPGVALLSGAGYRVRVISVTRPSLLDASNAVFSLSDGQQLFADGFE